VCVYTQPGSPPHGLHDIIDAKSLCDNRFGPKQGENSKKVAHLDSIQKFGNTVLLDSSSPFRISVYFTPKSIPNVAINVQADFEEEPKKP